MLKIFVTGIGTGIGKTLTCAVLCEALEADYWKPIQAGNLDHSDAIVVKSLLSNSKSQIHGEKYKLSQPMSPHAAANIDGVQIDLKSITLPRTSNSLVIEGAGGLMVPLNDEALMVDLIAQLGVSVVVVSQNYLGSINHTLLTCEAIERRRIPILGIVFNGDAAPTSESFIRDYTELSMLGRINQEREITAAVVSAYAEKFRHTLMFLHRRKDL
jgi:dethiobiotin synthetase